MTVWGVGGDHQLVFPNSLQTLSAPLNPISSSLGSLSSLQEKGQQSHPECHKVDPREKDLGSFWLLKNPPGIRCMKPSPETEDRPDRVGRSPCTDFLGHLPLCPLPPSQTSASHASSHCGHPRGLALSSPVTLGCGLAFPVTHH